MSSSRFITIVIYRNLLFISFLLFGSLNSTCQSLDSTRTRLTYLREEQKWEREYVVHTDSGFIQVLESTAPLDTVFFTDNVSYYFPEPSNYSDTDLQGRTAAITSVNWNNGWYFIFRKLVAYTPSGKVSDTTFQSFQNGWNDSLQHYFIYDNNDSLVEVGVRSFISSQWVPVERELRSYTPGGYLASKSTQQWNGSSWDNINLEEVMYNQQYLDSVTTLSSGSGSLWVPVTRTVRVYDTSGYLIEETGYSWDGTAWVSVSLSTYTYYGTYSGYDCTNQLWDGSSFVNSSLIHIHWDALGLEDTVLTHSWNGSAFEPVSLYTYIHFNLTDYQETEYVDAGGTFAPRLATSYYFDSLGRLIRRSTMGFAGSSGGDVLYTYDDEGYLIGYSSFFSTMGGLITGENSYYSRLLRSYFPNQLLTGCNGDTLPTHARVFGGKGIRVSAWQGNGYLSNPSITDPLVSSSGISRFYVQLTDSIGNVFLDSLDIDIAPLPTVNLGSDQTYCTPLPLTLSAGPGHEAYLWNTGATDSVITFNFTPYDSLTFWVTVTDRNCSASDTANIFYEPCTNLDDHPDSNGLTIYPNPSTGIIRLSWSKDSRLMHDIILSDMIGNTIREIPINNTKNDLILALDVPAGYYLLRVEGDSGTFQNHRIAVVR